MHQLKFIFVLLMVLFGLTACASSGKMAGDEMPPAVLPSKVTAVGHGAMPLGEGLSQAQRHLLAMRAAKLDAYRSLAETVAGIKIVGSSTVSAMALTSDSYKAYVEAYLRGAKIVSITPLPDGAFETILELTLGGDFYRAAPVPMKDAAVAPHTPVVPTPMPAVPQPLAAQISPSQNYYLSL
ncbi:LPP20 family lipoprotein [uncultured Deefgea sp.]|uniref:LPP20 family lipoprotein n=1 Tax=uncultured Deefgea sp. TaxID=1304914 RepID=UPI002599CEBF|nr:LPP20 family lipoprotein [uncultured Deefgea sp.]